MAFNGQEATKGRYRSALAAPQNMAIRQGVTSGLMLGVLMGEPRTLLRQTCGAAKFGHDICLPVSMPERIQPVRRRDVRNLRPGPLGVRVSRSPVNRLSTAGGLPACLPALCLLGVFPSNLRRFFLCLAPSMVRRASLLARCQVTMGHAGAMNVEAGAMNVEAMCLVPMRPILKCPWRAHHRGRRPHDALLRSLGGSCPGAGRAAAAGEPRCCIRWQSVTAMGNSTCSESRLELWPDGLPRMALCGRGHIPSVCKSGMPPAC